jgi:hypothetical protein
MMRVAAHLGGALCLLALGCSPEVVVDELPAAAAGGAAGAGGGSEPVCPGEPYLPPAADERIPCDDPRCEQGKACCYDYSGDEPAYCCSGSHYDYFGNWLCEGEPPCAWHEWCCPNGKESYGSDCIPSGIDARAEGCCYTADPPPWEASGGSAQ